jgi:adenine-specific DNA-methyltransferase
LLYPPKGRHWTNSQEKFDQMEKDGRLRINFGIKYTDVCGKKVDFIPEKLQDSNVAIDNNWTDIHGYEFGVFTKENFSTQNSEILIERIVKLITKKGDLILDFFTGSATTQAVAQKLGRKWIGVEMGNQFFDVDVPRIKQVMFGKQSNISKTLKEKYSGSGFFKYYSLEQYEDTLRTMRYKNTSPTDLFDKKAPFATYVFYADEKFAHAIDTAKNTPSLDLSALYPDIDLPETISHATGLPIKHIASTHVVLKDGTEECTVRYDTQKMSEKELSEFLHLLKPYLWWGRE